MTRYDPAWLDEQYNNRARIPEHPRIFERWARDSDRARATWSRRLDIAYGAGPAETLDVFPSVRANAPVLFYIHGGYWRALDKRDQSFVGPAFARDGAMTVLTNYALAPTVTLETIAVQLTQALAWTWRHAPLYGGDRRRIVVAGHSAGGHLTGLLLTCRWKDVGADLPDDLLCGGLAISGLFDLEPLRQTPFLRDDLRLTPASVRRLSPAYLPAPRAPLHAVVGGLESPEFLRQNELIRAAWGPNAVPVCEAIAGFDHLTVLDDFIDPEGRSHRLALELLGLAEPNA